MTSPDLNLDPADLAANPLTLYRLTSSKYAELTGKGAARSHGRWNQPREEAIYTSLNMATTVLERLAHTPKDEIPSNLAMLSISLSGLWTGGHHRRDPGTGSNWSIFSSLALAYAAYSHPNHLVHQSFAVALPSVILPVWNVVFYPERTGFWRHVKMQGSEPFTLDPRLFPDDANASF